MKQCVTFNVEIKNVEEAKQTVAVLIEKLKEARVLAGELASDLEKVGIEVAPEELTDEVSTLMEDVESSRRCAFE